MELVECRREGTTPDTKLQRCLDAQAADGADEQGISDEEREKRQRSDFLADVNHQGEHAVFNSTRHGHGSRWRKQGCQRRTSRSRCTTATAARPSATSTARARASAPRLPRCPTCPILRLSGMSPRALTDRSRRRVGLKRDLRRSLRRSLRNPADFGGLGWREWPLRFSRKRWCHKRKRRMCSNRAGSSVGRATDF